MTPESIRDLLASAVKRAQAEADIRRYELEEYERANGFRSNVQKTQIAFGPVHQTAPSLVTPRTDERLDASRAYREVTGRDAFAGAERIAVTPSSGNVFADLGFEDPEARLRLAEQKRAERAGAEIYTRRSAEDIHD